MISNHCILAVYKEGKVVDLTDKELKSLSKVQMLDLLYQQEEEIQRLKGELAKPQAGPGSALLDEIMLATQAAADAYLKNVKSSENDRINGIANLEREAKVRFEEAERYANETIETIRESTARMNEVFVGLKGIVASMHEEFKRKLAAANPYGVAEPSPVNSPALKTADYAELKTTGYAATKTTDYTELKTTGYAATKATDYTVPKTGISTNLSLFDDDVPDRYDFDDIDLRDTTGATRRDALGYGN